MILEIVATVLIFLVIIVSAFLLIPFNVVFGASFSLERLKSHFSISWLGLTLWRSMPETQKPKNQREEKEPKKKRRLGIVNFFRMATLFRESIPAILIIAKSGRTAISVRRIELECVFGSGDPAETAYIAGTLWSFLWALNNVPGVSIVFRPVFEAQELNGSMFTNLNVRAFPLAIGFLRAYMKKPFRRLIKEARAR